MTEQRHYDEYTEKSDRSLADQVEQEQATEEKETVLNLIKVGDRTDDALPRFLWYPYIPLENITVLFGKQGAGKGFAYAAIGAAISNGKRPFSTKNYKPENVLVISAEETDGTIWRKFKYSGADMEKIGRIGCETVTNEGKPVFNIAERPEELENVIKAFRAKLVIIDPIQDFIGVKNLNAAEEVGAALVKLRGIAERCECAIVYTAHPSKKSVDIDAIDAVAGSAEFTRKPRSVLQVIYDETGENDDRRIIVPIKANDNPLGESVAFEITAVDAPEIIEQTDDETTTPAKARFTGYSAVTADMVSAAASRKKRLSEYLIEHPIDTPDKFTLAKNTLLHLAETIGKNPLYLSRKGLVQRFPAYFGGTFPKLIAALKRPLYERGYLIEYTDNIGDSKVDYYGFTRDRCVKITRKEDSTERECIV